MLPRRPADVAGWPPPPASPGCPLPQDGRAPARSGKPAWRPRPRSVPPCRNCWDSAPTCSRSGAGRTGAWTIGPRDRSGNASGGRRRRRARSGTMIRGRGGRPARGTRSTGRKAARPDRATGWRRRRLKRLGKRDGVVGWQVVPEARGRRVLIVTSRRRCAAGDLEVERVSGPSQEDQVGRRRDRDIFLGSPGLAEFIVVDAAPRQPDGGIWLPFRQQGWHLVFVVPLGRLLLVPVVIRVLQTNW